MSPRFTPPTAPSTPSPVRFARRPAPPEPRRADLDEVAAVLRSLVTLLGLLEDSLRGLPRPRVEVVAVDVPAGTTKYKAR